VRPDGTAERPRCGARPLWKAVVLGLGWASGLIGFGIEETMRGAPTIWIFVGPWSVPGILLAVWGMRAWWGASRD